MRITKVITPVAMPTTWPAVPFTTSCTRRVAKLAAAILTKLLPIKIVISQREGFVNKNST